MKTFLCEFILSCMGLGPTAMPLDELTYGNVLFEYYQGNLDQALVLTLTAEEQERLGTNRIRFDLAKGSFAFSDGMYDYARETFDSLDPEELTRIDRLRLSFHLSREYYRRQDWPALEAQLAKIDLGSTWFGRDVFHPEVEFMRSELAVHNNEFDIAARALERVPEDDALRLYGNFNLGVALRAAGNLPAAEVVFANLARSNAYDEEALDLIERSKLALAFIRRETSATASAEAILGSLPGDSRYRDLALATYGSLAMDGEDYELAARIWLTLQNQEYWTPSTATARLGFPVSLEKMASQDAALFQYQAAERSFEQRLGKLTTLQNDARDPAWVSGLLEVFSAPQQDSNQIGALVERWQNELGHTDWLEWLSAEDIHKVLLEWRELGEMKAWLTQLPATLEIWGEVAEVQKVRARKASQLLNDDGLIAHKENLEEQLIVARDRLLGIQQSQPESTFAWIDQLATSDEHELLADLAAMEANVMAHMNAEVRNTWLARIKRLRGVLFWQVLEEKSTRMQALRVKVRTSEEDINALSVTVARVTEAENQLIAGAHTDFVLFEDRARDIVAQVDDARSVRTERLARELRDGMQREVEQVQQYLLITRIAIARAVDQLALAQEMTPGVTP